MSRISIIAAMTKEGVIGRNNALPAWSIPGDLKRFRQLTTGKVILMGRRTFESLGKPLPNRWNVVVSATMKQDQEGFLVVRSFEEGIALAMTLNPDGSEIMVIGGSVLYREALAKADRLYLTVLDEVWEGDTYFPEFNMEQWKMVENEVQGSHSFCVYDRV